MAERFTTSLSSFTLKSSWSYNQKIWDDDQKQYYYYKPTTPSTASKTVSVSLASIPTGSRVVSASLQIRTSNSSSTATIGGKTFNVNNDHTSGINIASGISSLGSSLSIVFKFQYSGSPSVPSSSSSGSRSSYFSEIKLIIDYELPASSGTTSVTSIDAGSGSVTLTIDPSNTSYTHQVTWYVGDTVISGPTTIAAGTTTASCSYPLSVCQYIPNATSATGKVVLQTYNDSTLMGSNEYTFTINVPASVVPTAGTLSATAVTTGADVSMASTFVQGYSTANLSLADVAGAYGSTITSVVFSGWGSTANGTASGTAYTAQTSTLTSSGTITLQALVTDSRGRTVTKTANITVYAYAKPTISSITAKRCNDDQTINDQGEYALVTVTYTFASVNNLNSVTTASYFKQLSDVAYQNAGQTFTSNTSFMIGDDDTISFSPDISYNIKVTVADKVGNTATAITSIPTATYVMHFRDGGTSVAVGRAALDEENIFAVNDSWRIRAYGGLLQPHTVMVGSIPSGVNLNSYLTAGEYAIETDAIATSLTNRPCDLSGKLIVGSSRYNETTHTIDNSTHCFMYQMYMVRDLSAIYIRNIYTGASSGAANAVFSAWKRLMYSTDDLSTTSFTGALPISNGGTGQTTIEGIRTALNVSQDIKSGDVIDISGYKAAGWVTSSRGQFRSSICFGRRITATAVAIAGTGWIIGPGGKVIGGDSAANITTMGTFTYSIKSDAGFIGFVFSKSFSTTNNTPHTLEIATGTLTFS